MWGTGDVGSRNCDLAQVGRQQPLARTGRAGGQVVHWVKAPPEHDAQSGWHDVHVVEEKEENVFEELACTHFPSEVASWLFAQVRQNLGSPAQVQDESHAIERRNH